MGNLNVLQNVFKLKSKTEFIPDPTATCKKFPNASYTRDINSRSGNISRILFSNFTLSAFAYKITAYAWSPSLPARPAS